MIISLHTLQYNYTHTQYLTAHNIYLILRLKDNALLEEGERFKMFSDESGNTKLVIKDIKPSDSGLYFCVAENNAGKAKCAATLRVVGECLFVIFQHCMAIVK